ncbi:hypothetical protein [Streptomyces sp. RFCAC02]|uniref:hypothetical protein n=1 Tax=Streptomyces sp. RFCAC02 TaxID=2499143 RepID=UPI001F0E9513|nr:hypothetical protein [Streptomyces sp. RFCAC02]
MSTHHQVEPYQQVEILRPESLLHRQPQLPVHTLAPRGQEHEHVVPQEITLAEPDSRVVDGLEDPVHVVTGLRGDLDDREQILEDGLDSGLPAFPAVGAALGEGSQEEAIRSSHRVPAAGLRGGRHTRGERIAIGLGWEQPVVVQPFMELVDQHLAVYTVRGTGIPDMFQVVPQSGEGQHQRRQTLLAVHYEPALHSPRLQTARSENDGPEKMRRRALPAEVLLHQLTDVVPQPVPLRSAPAVSALVQRHLELLLALDELEERDLLSPHRPPSWSPCRVDRAALATRYAQPLTRAVSSGNGVRSLASPAVMGALPRR